MNKPIDVTKLLKRIEAFCRKTKTSESRFGRNVCNNSSAVARIRAGSYTAHSLRRMSAYLDQQP